MLRLFVILIWPHSWDNFHESGPIPARKIDQFVLDFFYTLVTFHFHLFFLIEKEHTDAKNSRISYEKSKLKTRNLDILSSPSPTQRLAIVSHFTRGMNGSIINLQVF